MRDNSKMESEFLTKNGDAYPVRWSVKPDAETFSKIVRSGEARKVGRFVRIPFEAETRYFADSENTKTALEALLAKTSNAEK